MMYLPIKYREQMGDQRVNIGEVEGHLKMIRKQMSELQKLLSPAEIAAIDQLGDEYS